MKPLIIAALLLTAAAPAPKPHDFNLGMDPPNPCSKLVPGIVTRGRYVALPADAEISAARYNELTNMVQCHAELRPLLLKAFEDKKITNSEYESAASFLAWQEITRELEADKRATAEARHNFQWKLDPSTTPSATMHHDMPAMPGMEHKQ